ncbi:MAG: hypothetical protein ABJE10_05385 [bacterium]
MVDAIPSALKAWENFYVIVGSSGAALTGLQFVVIALISEARTTATSDTIGAFGTPTIVHFCAVLFVAAVLSSPWPELSSAAIVLDVSGGVGVGYMALVIRRARNQMGYKPVLEDWIFHTALPLAAYATLLMSGATLVRHSTAALFAIAATCVLLLFIGIHNAWDTVTYVALEQKNATARDGATQAPQHSGARKTGKKRR